VLDEVFSCLTAWLAPILCFTAEEAWLERSTATDDSVHLRQFPTVPEGWRDDALAAKWETIRRLRRVVTGAIEIERREKRIGASLQAHPTIYAGPEYVTALDEDAFALDEVANVGVVASLAEGSRCERCWQVLPEVGADSERADICVRCADAVAHAPG
jgi:isoleucyl-tRNA synthetase